MYKYKTIKILGDGAFGTVYKSANIKTGEFVAIKKMKQKYTNWNYCIELRYVKSLRKLNHPNLIKLKYVLLVSEYLYMVFEYLEYNLYYVYSKMKYYCKRFTYKEIKSMLFQIFSGLASMHRNGFFHRDMKPYNLLIYNNVVKICDLGLAREIRSRPPFTDYVSTRWYRAPELLLRSTNYNSPVDVFAMGCIMAELYTLCPLFAGSNEIDQLNKIVKILGTPDKSDWPEGYKLAQAKGYYFADEKGINLSDLIPDASIYAIDLIESMLQYSSRKRPTAAEILKHDYFKGMNLQLPYQPNKYIVFYYKPSGVKLDTHKYDKNIDIFRATKEKFKQTRKHDVFESNIFKFDKPAANTYADDLDSILRELEDKNSRKKQAQVVKLPLLDTREKFYTKVEKKDMRESKTELKHNDVKYIEKDDWRGIRGDGKEESRQPRINEFKRIEKDYRHKFDYQSYKKYLEKDTEYPSNYKKHMNPFAAHSSSNPSPPSKKEIGLPAKFSYSFQPSILPSYLPLPNNGTRTAMNVGLGYTPLPKPNMLYKKPYVALIGHYKF